MFKIDVKFNVIFRTFRNVQYMTHVEGIAHAARQQIQQDVRKEVRNVVCLNTWRLKGQTFPCD